VLMLRKLGLSGLALAALLLNAPAASAQRHNERGFRMGERHEGLERRPYFRRPYYVAPAYPYWWGDPYSGYYDQWGFWHPYPW